MKNMAASKFYCLLAFLKQDIVDCPLGNFILCTIETDLEGLITIYRHNGFRGSYLEEGTREDGPSWKVDLPVVDEVHPGIDSGPFCLGR
jgi:hypothetical protein